MKHTYQVSGMTCEGCVSKVKSSLLAVPGITGVEMSLADESATLTMDRHVSLEVLQGVLPDKYRISPSGHEESHEEIKSWFATYKPIVLIFLYITLVTLLIQWSQSSFHPDVWMRHFMAGFFLVFSFFKMLDLRGFAGSYVMYDVIARKIPAWAYVYAFLELGLGLAYLTNVQPLMTNIVTFVVMSISIIGVLQSVLNKKVIQCACLGAVFNLPMSTVTIIEDGLMILMSTWMIFSHLG